MSEFSTQSIINKCNKIKPEKYNILTFPTHERYETQLSKTGHNFYSFHLKDSKKWNSQQVVVPTNYHILPEGDLCSYINYDFILSQSKFWQYQVAKQIQQSLKIPIISLEHTLPTPQTLSIANIEAMKNMVGDINVFISEYSANQWGITNNLEIIHHGIDTNQFTDLKIDREDYVLTVANDFVNRDYCLNYKGWSRVTKNIKTKLVGDTKGLSEPAESTEALVLEYNKCAVYFNSSTLSPIPTSLLEAMSCGCAVVSTANCMIPEIIQNGVNGFISNDETELRSKIEYLLYNKEAREQIGKAARQTILEKFPETSFINKWNTIFDTAYRISLK
jgi:glycosyltransferase involved in cell wall biosynthesis